MQGARRGDCLGIHVDIGSTRLVCLRFLNPRAGIVSRRFGSEHQLHASAASLYRMQMRPCRSDRDLRWSWRGWSLSDGPHLRSPVAGMLHHLYTTGKYKSGGTRSKLPNAATARCMRWRSPAQWYGFVFCSCFEIVPAFIETIDIRSRRSTRTNGYSNIPYHRGVASGRALRSAG